MFELNATLCDKYITILFNSYVVNYKNEFGHHWIIQRQHKCYEILKHISYVNPNLIKKTNKIPVLKTSNDTFKIYQQIENN